MPIPENFFSNLSISELYASINYIDDPSSYPMVYPDRRNSVLFYTYKGTDVYHFKDQTLYTYPNTITYIPPGVQYTIHTQSDVSASIAIDFDTTEPVTVHPFSVPVSPKSTFFLLFEESARIWKNKKTGYRQECMANLYRLLALLAKQQEAMIHPAKYGIIKDAVDFLHEHYTDPDFRTEKLAELSGITPRYFYILFSQKFNMSPKEYLTGLRMERAKELLADYKYNVSEISQQLGYSDVYHFSKIFKLKNSCSPLEYRRELTYRKN